MKKSLAVILSTTMALSAFSSAALAASSSDFSDLGNLSAADKAVFDKLIADGVFLGMGDGTFGVNENMTRAHFAVAISKALNLPSSTATSTFADVSADAPELPYIEAAYKAGIANGLGTTPNTFNPDGEVTKEELAVFLVGSIGKKAEAEAATGTDATVDEWAQGYVATALKYKLIAPKADGTFGGMDAATRYMLALGTGAAQAEVAAQQAASISEFKATGAKKLTVSFNKAVDDTKATFELKKGAAKINVNDVTFSADKKSVVLSTAAKLSSGEDYTVNVSGLSDTALTKSVTVEDEKIAKIEIPNATAPSNWDAGTDTVVGTNDDFISSISVYFKTFNQYGEDVTKDGTVNQPNWSASYGASTVSTAGNLNVAYNFTRGQSVYVTAYVGAVSVTKEITVGDKARATSIKVVGVYNEDGAELNNGNVSDNVLLLEATDQYGNPVAAANLATDVTVNSTNPTIVSVDSDPANVFVDNAGEDGDQLGALLLDGTTNSAGKANILIVPKFGGTVVSYELNVAKKASLDSFTLSAPATVVGAGEIVDVPFTAYDQFGTQLKKYSDIQPYVTLGAGLAFSKDPVTDNAVLKYTAGGEGTASLFASITGTGKTSNILITVKTAKAPKSVTNTVDLSTALAVGASTSLTAEDNLVVGDQYGLDYDLDTLFTDGYQIKVESNNAAITVDGGASTVITSASQSVAVAATGTDKANVTLTFSLLDSTSAPVTGSALDKKYRVVTKADIASYAADDVAKIYIDAPHAKSVKVYGKLSDGSKVVLPASQYSVVTTISGATVTGNSINAAGVPAFGTSEDERKGLAIVTIDGKDGAVTIEKDVVVTDVAPVIATVTPETAAPLTVKDGVVYGAAADISIANLNAVFNAGAVDQYGVDTVVDNGTTVKSFYSFTGLSKATGSTIALTSGFTSGATTPAAITGTVTAGDTFTVTLITSNGIRTSLKVKAN